jgi:hypothetical protein
MAIPRPVLSNGPDIRSKNRNRRASARRFLKVNNTGWLVHVRYHKKSTAKQDDG